MKKFKLLAIAALLAGTTLNIAAQDYVYTTINVYGSRYSDEMMLFIIPGCTHGFDNGWDAPKMFGNYLTPQLFNVEPDEFAYYQINSVDDINNTYLGFKSGEDSIYTLFFNHNLIDTKYQQLYLIDSVANKTVSILKSGANYSFSVNPFSDIVKRFKIVTTLPVVVPPPTPPVTPPVVPVVNNNSSKNTVTSHKDAKNEKSTKEKKIKIMHSKHMIAIDNQSNQKATVKVFDSKNAKCMNNWSVGQKSKSSMNHKLKRGAYIVTVENATENSSCTIIVE